MATTVLRPSLVLPTTRNPASRHADSGLGKWMAARTADPDLGHYFLAAGAFRATVRHEPMAIAS